MTVMHLCRGFMNTWMHCQSYHKWLISCSVRGSEQDPFAKVQIQTADAGS